MSFARSSKKCPGDSRQGGSTLEGLLIWEFHVYHYISLVLFLRTKRYQICFATGFLATLVDNAATASATLRGKQVWNIVHITFVNLVTCTWTFFVVEFGSHSVQVERFEIKIGIRIHWKEKEVNNDLQKPLWIFTWLFDRILSLNQTSHGR